MSDYNPKYFNKQEYCKKQVHETYLPGFSLGSKSVPYDICYAMENGGYYQYCNYDGQRKILFEPDGRKKVSKQPSAKNKIQLV